MILKSQLFHLDMAIIRDGYKEIGVHVGKPTKTYQLVVRPLCPYPPPPLELSGHLIFSLSLVFRA